MLIFNFIVIGNIFFATLIILSSNPIYSIISLVCVIVSSSCILFFLEVEFLSFILLLIYIGAIAVLFLFVVMLLQVNNVVTKKRKDISVDVFLYAFILSKCLYFFYFFNKKLSMATVSIFSGYMPVTSLNITSSISFSSFSRDSSIFLNLFVYKSYFFIVVGFLLLFSMVGAIVLCIKKQGLIR